MCVHLDCSTCPFAAANPLKLTASANVFPLSLVTHNTRIQRNLEIHSSDVSTRFYSFYATGPFNAFDGNKSKLHVNNPKLYNTHISMCAIVSFRDFLTLVPVLHKTAALIQTLVAITVGQAASWSSLLRSDLLPVWMMTSAAL